MRRGICRILICATLALIVSAPASTARAGDCAPSQMEMRSVPLSPTNWSSPLITIPKFDPANGTLCMVVVRLSASVEAQVQATNTSPTSAATLTATMHVNANITAPAPIANFSATPISSMQSINVPAAGMTTFLAGPNPSFVETNFVAPLDLASFTGAGQFLFFGASANGDFTFVTNTGNAVINGVSQASAKIEVTYWVPEPGSLAMLALGALCIVRRRRR